jgi:microtubule-associated protein-like 6
MACHPTLPQFCSAGDDKMLRVWSLFEKRMVRCNQLEMMSRACAYSPDGKQVAVGFGAPVKQTAKQFDGKFVIMNADDFAIVHEARDSQKWITELKYAPSGELLAVGSFDNRIYVYVFDGGVIKLQNMITQHNSFVTHVDFSVSANIMYLQSNCGAYELCFFEADTGMFIPAASRLKDVKWDSVTCPLTWSAPARDTGATFPTSKAPLSAVSHSFRPIFGRAIVPRSAPDAWMRFPERERAAHAH